MYNLQVQMRRGARILIITSDVKIAEDVEVKLNGLGYVVASTASINEEDVRKVAQSPLDLVLIDADLKNSATEVADTAAQIRVQTDVPTIYLVTSAASEARLIRVRAIREAFDYVCAPFTERELCVVIEAALYKREIERNGNERINQEIENALRASSSRYYELFENANDLVYTHSLEGQFTSLNKAGEIITGYSRDEAVQKNIANVVAPEHLKQAQQMIAEKVSGESATMYELDIIRKDGERVTLELSTRMIYEGGRAVGVQGIGRDVTERKRMEKQMHASEQRFTKAFNASPEPMIISRLEDGRYLYVNDSFLRLSGYSREEVIGRNTLELGLWANPEDGQRLIDMLAQQGRIDKEEINFRVKSGEVGTGLFSAEIIEVAGENCIISLTNDITERKQLEEQLRQSQKMEAVGQLAGGIAHDFNNLLTAINGYSDLTLRRLAPDDPVRSNVEEIQRAGERAASLTRQLLAFSRRQVLQPKVLDLNATVRETERMLHRLIGEDVRLVTRLDLQLGRISADPNQIEQVIMNLIVNARDAMPRGGQLIIETANVILSDAYVQKHRAMRPGNYVMLSASDTGIGMDVETQARVFEPFFTTKEQGKGTGLGLSTVYGIVKQSGGYIWVYSELEIGTTFKIYLPRIDAEIETTEQRVKARPARVADNWETILLVEDEKTVRGFVRETLELEGYSVLEADGGTQALHLCGQHQARIDLLLTDVVMPGMSGRELAKCLVDQSPQLCVLYMSGYTEDAIVHHGILDKNRAFLEKPFTPEALARKVREILDARIGNQTASLSAS